MLSVAIDIFKNHEVMIAKLQEEEAKLKSERERELHKWIEEANLFRRPRI